MTKKFLNQISRHCRNREQMTVSALFTKIVPVSALFLEIVTVSALVPVSALLCKRSVFLALLDGVSIPLVLLMRSACIVITQTAPSWRKTSTKH